MSTGTWGPDIVIDFGEGRDERIESEFSAGLDAPPTLKLAMECGLIGDDWYEIRQTMYGHEKRLTTRAENVLYFAERLMGI